jgi:hypothetical protein
MRGIDGRDYPLPSLEAVIAKMTETPDKKAFVARKIREFSLSNEKSKQKLPLLMIVPQKYPLGKRKTSVVKNVASMAGAVLAGMGGGVPPPSEPKYSYTGLMGVYAKLLRETATAGKLKDPDGNPITAKDTTTNEPLWLDDVLKSGNIDNIAYHFPSYDVATETLSGGWLKKDIPDNALTFPGFSVLLMEDMPDVPKSGEGKEVAGQEQIEGGSKVSDYLSYFVRQKDLAGKTEEMPVTIEGYLMYVITMLKTRGIVVDYTTYSYLMGTRIEATDGFLVPGAFFDSDRVRADLGRGNLDNRNDNSAPRRSVMI